MMFKWIYVLGRNLRNPSSKEIYRFLESSQVYTLNQLEDYQLKKLKDIVEFAYQHSEYYRKVFKEKGIKPSDISSLSDLEKLPIITKKELIKYNTEIHSDFKFQKTFKAKTSGTSGESLVFKRNEYSDSFNRTVINHNYSIFGVNPWDRNGYFWGFNPSLKYRLKTRFLDALQNRFRVFSYSKTELFKFIKKLKHTKYIHGYSSSIYETAKAINEGSMPKPIKIRMVKGTSEKIFDYYQPEIEKAFGTKMISEYGAAEAGIIAFECLDGNMHVNMEGVIVEEVNNEILVTNLHMLSFPIIRYKLGDYIKLAPRNTTCKCGKKHRILSDVLGRIGETVYGIQGKYPSLYFYYIFKNLSEKYGLNLEYQVLQEEKGQLVFNISSDLSEDEKDVLVKEIENYFETDMHFAIRSNTKLNVTKGKKKKSFISKVN
ncbi:phenylacetate--CoA ligase family protein [Flavisericum labens]|uniref:phenylacetate--CoA ligase family protein n=1 Tax=Flavisericum labens TaxID=3377112 RepID=UPI00387B8CA2